MKRDLDKLNQEFLDDVSKQHPVGIPVDGLRFKKITRRKND